MWRHVAQFFGQSVKMEGFLVKLFTFICSDLFPFESIYFILFSEFVHLLGLRTT